MTRLALAASFALAGVLAAGIGGASEVPTFTDAELRAILRHGPWPPPWAPDPSNRVSGKPDAVVLGEKLFFEPRLSGTGSVLCASCHVPFRGWQDSRPLAFGLEPMERNTPSLLNVRWQRWFGWDGAGDSLWAQSIRPILDAREMRASVSLVATLLRSDPEYACRYEKAFGTPPPGDDEKLLVDAAKALAAFQETLVTGRTPFDEFRDALALGDRAQAARYPAAAQRGLRTFVGKGACTACHVGPQFTNGEFHDIGVPYFTGPGRVDSGRHGGISRLLSNSHNLIGRFSDEPTRSSAWKTRHVELQHRNFGEFKVPGLRNVALTAPYMHNGHYASLRQVVRHYSELDPDRVHSDGEQVLRALRLSAQESADLVAFLETLSEKTGAIEARRPVAACRR